MPITHDRVARTIQDTLAGLQLGAPIVQHQLAMFPLLDRRPHLPLPSYLTLDEALNAGAARIGEVSEGGSVPELLFRNLGDRPVLLVEGEELVGAKQNRTLNVSILAPPHKEMPIPVTCVEAGRWGYDRGAAFQHTDRAHFARGRRTKRESVNASMRAAPDSRRADQSAVWREIDSKMAAMRARSDTAAMGDIYDQNRGSLEDYVGAFAQQPGQVGAVFMVGAGFAGLDLFAHTATFGTLLPKLVRSYALDALEQRRAAPFNPSADAARRLVAEAAAAQATGHPAVGQGSDVRLESPAIAGGALVTDNAVLHLVAFRREAGNGAPDAGNFRRASQRRMNRMRTH